jgi:alkanesulfonate monooxygenase SsuD/methylene tetrahydromethanopterin reductase-like flavin-dependent oxidoreductase (luciferase family)
LRIGWNGGGAHTSLDAIRAEARRAAREGVAGPEDLLVAGSAAKVRDQLAEYAAAGATDLRAGALCASEAETECTRALLGELARQGGLE